MPPSHFLMSQECCCFHLVVPKRPCNRHYVCGGLTKEKWSGSQAVHWLSPRLTEPLERYLKPPHFAPIFFPTLPQRPLQHHLPPLCACEGMVSDIKQTCNLPAVPSVSIPRANTQRKTETENICT